MKLRLVTLMLLSCTLLCWAQPNAFLDRNQVLINVIQDEGATEFSRYLERPDIASLDGEPVAAADLHVWLQQYLGARTLVSGSLDDSSQSGIIMSFLRFEEQDEPLALEWVQLKGGQYYLRGVQAPRPVSRQNRSSKPEFVKNPNRTNDEYSEQAEGALADPAQFPEEGYSNGGASDASSRNFGLDGMDITTGILRELSRGNGYRGHGARRGFRILRSIFR